jgi:ubiquinol-cytochrome c reductase cytochrome c1 subunit
MKKIIFAILFYLAPAVTLASGGACGEYMHDCDKASVDLTNTASIQRGAKLFVNYCMGCHSAKYMSYERMGNDLGLTKEQVEDNLMFTGSKVGDYMTIAMPESGSKEWFGTQPPDLTLVSRSRGNDWLYTYLRTFYVDESRPFGFNNLAFKDVGMPHVLWELEGIKKAVFKEHTDEEGKKHKEFIGFEQVKDGSMTPAQYEMAVRDLVNFFAYAGEPAKLKRLQMGIWVIVFLVGFLVIAYLLKKEYWKDIH